MSLCHVDDFAYLCSAIMITDFEEYIRQGEPSRAERAQAWRTAIGLQDVDGLKPSAYLIDIAREHIEGDISLREVRQRIESYYESRTAREDTGSDERTKEADLRNRTLHIKADGLTVRNEPLKYDLKVQNEPLNNLTGKASLTEIAVLQLIEENPSVKIEEMAANTKKSRSTIKRAIDRLREKGIIERTGAKKNGSWKILNGNEH